MDLLYEIKNSLLTILPPSIFDVLDIALLSVLIYYILKFMRQNRAGGLFKGLVVIVAAYLVAKLVHMKALVFLLENAFSIGLIALVILFQPELRRSLENMGQSKLMDFTKGSKPNPWEKPIAEICRACSYFADNSVGALIVIERNEKLGEQIKTGTAFKSEINSLLLENIFFVNAPLHDGAVIIQDGEIVAAGCMLPSTSRPELVDKALGSRHKAALGMSENSDAIIIVVSEETSVISIAENRSLTRGLSVDALKTMLTEKLMPGAKTRTEQEEPAANSEPVSEKSGEAVSGSDEKTSSPRDGSDDEKGKEDA
ncbi:MAG: diadenylate cyclase CdaA [Huintestinicola sp.]|uniref:diadenylate cyclase CdaA n=1 Tax=Huintestinicola sp. TaxID=2981661 RepID=UPI003EFE85A7